MRHLLIHESYLLLLDAKNLRLSLHYLLTSFPDYNRHIWRVKSAFAAISDHHTISKGVQAARGEGPAPGLQGDSAQERQEPQRCSLLQR